MKKIYVILTLTVFMFLTGCESQKNETKKPNNKETEKYSEMLNYKEALEILKEDVEAEVLDIETGITFKVKRVVGGFNTLADVETLTLKDTQKLLKTCGGSWNIKRRAVIVTVGDKKLAASIAPFEHSGSESHKYGDIIDNRSGSTGTGINLDSIRDNEMVGVVDIFFYNSVIPGVNRVDERHQEKVLEAASYEA